MTAVGMSEKFVDALQHELAGEKAGALGRCARLFQRRAGAESALPCESRGASRADARDRFARHVVELEHVARVAQAARFALNDERLDALGEIPQ